MTTLKSLDLRWTSASPSYKVSFASRRPSLSPVSAGHAFVIVVDTASGNTTSFGLYPKSASDIGKAVLGPVPPAIINKDWKTQADVFVEALVSKAQHDIVKATVTRWQSGTYQLVYNDCASFALEVAGNLMMKQPIKEGLDPGEYLPHNLIEKMQQINAQSDFIFGEWESDDPQRRWSLSVRDVDCDFRERTTAGAVLTRKVPVKLKTFDLNGSTRTTWQIERDNDAEVLRFLGAKESVVGPILKLGPKPSSAILKRTSISDAELDWSGLSWRLDAAGKLAGIDQPGSKPVRNFKLKRSF